MNGSQASWEGANLQSSIYAFSTQSRLTRRQRVDHYVRQLIPSHFDLSKKKKMFQPIKPVARRPFLIAVQR